MRPKNLESTVPPSGARSSVTGSPPDDRSPRLNRRISNKEYRISKWSLHHSAVLCSAVRYAMLLISCSHLWKYPLSQVCVKTIVEGKVTIGAEEFGSRSSLQSLQNSDSLFSRCCKIETLLRWFTKKRITSLHSRSVAKFTVAKLFQHLCSARNRSFVVNSPAAAYKAGKYGCNRATQLSIWFNKAILLLTWNLPSKMPLLPFLTDLAITRKIQLNRYVKR